MIIEFPIYFQETDHIRIAQDLIKDNSRKKMKQTRPWIILNSLLCVPIAFLLVVLFDTVTRAIPLLHQTSLILAAIFYDFFIFKLDISPYVRFFLFLSPLKCNMIPNRNSIPFRISVIEKGD